MDAYLDYLDNQAVDSVSMSRLLQEALRLYSQISFQRQLAMLVAKWKELSEQQGIAVTEPETWSSDFEILQEKAPEPLCWRKMENTAGLTVAAADVLFWKHSLDSKDARGRTSRRTSRANRGFATQSDGVEKSSEELKPSGKDLDMCELVGATVNYLLPAMAERMPGNEPVRLLLPQEMEKTAGRRIFEAFSNEDRGCQLEVQTFSGCPTWDQLVTESHCMVCVYREATVPASSECWTLPVDSTHSVRAVAAAPVVAAPVLVVSILEHGVRMNFPGTYNKMSQWLQQAFETDFEDQEPADFFSQLSQVFASKLGDDAERFLGSRVKCSAASATLQSKLSIVIKKAYGASWMKLVTARLQQLEAGRKDAQLLLRRQRERDAAAAIMLADLAKAVQSLDVEKFQKKSRVAQREQLLTTTRLESLQEQMAFAIGAAQAPIKQLADTCCSDIEEALNVEVLGALRTELARTQLTMSDPWLQAGLELKLALEALHQLHIDMNEFLNSHSSTASASSTPSEMPGEGTDSNSNSEAVARLAKDLTEASDCLDRFERRLRASGREVSSEGVRPLRRFLSQCDSKLIAARRDDELDQMLRSPPWRRESRLLAGVTKEAWQKLQDVADQATDDARSRLHEQLQEASSVVQLADQLRKATQGDDEDALQKLLGQAAELNISGLGNAQRRCEQLRSMRSDLRKSLADAVAELDLARFEALQARSAQLPAEELEKLRQGLHSSIAEEEHALQEVINSDLSEDGLRGALTKCRLSSKNAWRRLAETSLVALEAANKIRTALGCVPVDEMALQACLSSGSFAAKELQESSTEVQNLDEGNQPSGAAFSTLQTALDDGYLGLAGAQADQALETLLSSKSWDDWEAIQPSDLRELEVRAEGATKEGRNRLAQPLQTALEVGQCSVELAASMKNNAEKLEACLKKAEELGFKGLDRVRRRLQSMRLSMEGRGPRRVVRSVAFQRQPQEPLPLQREQSSPLGGKDSEDVWKRAGSSWSSQKPVQAGDQGKQDKRMHFEDVQDPQVRCTNLIFIDLETTSGFYDFDQRPKILEVAIIVTDRDLCELDRGHWVLGGFSQEELEGLGEFHKENFRDAKPGGSFPPLDGYSGGNGLFSDILSSRLSTEEVEEQVMQIVTLHCPPGECPLVGYSVQCDREVLKDRMPRLYRHLSHQIVDVSGFFIVARLWLPEQWQYWDRKSSNYNHRAVNDVEDAIQALRWVRDKFFSESVLPFGASKDSSSSFSALSLPGISRK